MFSSINVYSGWKDAGAGCDGEQVILITNQADRAPIIVNFVFLIFFLFSSFSCFWFLMVMMILKMMMLSLWFHSVFGLLTLDINITWICGPENNNICWLLDLGEWHVCDDDVNVTITNTLFTKVKFIQIHSYDKDIMTLMSTLTLFRDMGELDEVASLAERGALMYRQVGILALGWCWWWWW